MYYHRHNNVFERKRIVKKFDFDLTLEKISRRDCSNVKTAGGISNADALVRVDVTRKVSALLAVIQDFVYFTDYDNSLCRYNLAERSLHVYSENQSNVRAFIAFNGTLIISFVNGVYRVDGDSLVKISSLRIASFCEASGRLWAAANNGKLYFSDLGSTDCFTEYLTFPRGGIYSLVSVRGNIYAIGADVYKIQPNADDYEIKMTLIAQNVNASNRSVTVCGDKIFFVSQNKLMCLSQEKVRVALKTFGEGILYSCSFAYGGYIFITCRSVNGVYEFVLQIDADDYSVAGCINNYIYNGAVSDDGTVFVVDKLSKLYYLLDVGCNCFWREIVKLSDSEQCYLQKLTLRSMYPVKVKIITDSGMRWYSLTSRNYYSSQIIPLFGRSKTVTVEFYSNDFMRITDAVLYAEIRGQNGKKPCKNART